MKNEGMINLKKIVKAKNKSLTSLAVELEVSQEAVSQYISGKILPKATTIIKMAEILNTSTDYLLGLTNDSSSSNLQISESENNLLNKYRILNEKEKMKIDSYLDAIIDLKN